MPEGFSLARALRTREEALCLYSRARPANVVFLIPLLPVLWLSQCTTWLTHSRQSRPLLSRAGVILHCVPALWVTGKCAM
jgi:hypothetical protein